MKTNTVLKRTLSTLMAFTLLITAVCGFTAINASAAENEDEIKIVRTISDENATAYIYENGYGTIEFHKTFTKENPLTKIDGVPLKEIIKFDNGGYISYLYSYTNVNPWIYDYGIYVYGHGLSGLFAEGHLSFYDKTGDVYDIILWANKYGGHTVDYNSDDPTVTKVNWWTTL